MEKYLLHLQKLLLVEDTCFYNFKGIGHINRAAKETLKKNSKFVVEKVIYFVHTRKLKEIVLMKF